MNTQTYRGTSAVLLKHEALDAFCVPHHIETASQESSNAS